VRNIYLLPIGSQIKVCGIKQYSFDYKIGDRYGPSCYSPLRYGPTSYSPLRYGPSKYGPLSTSPWRYGPSRYGPSRYGPSRYGRRGMVL
jgi:hypothetical protein